MEPAEGLEEMYFPGRWQGDLYGTGARYLLCHQGKLNHRSAVPADTGVQVRRDQYEVQLKKPEHHLCHVTFTPLIPNTTESTSNTLPEE